MLNRDIARHLNIYNALALSLIVFGILVIVNTVPISQLSKLTEYISPFIGVFMFLVKYFNDAKKEERKNVESLERSLVTLEQSYTLLNAQLDELSNTINKNTTNIAINAAKLEIIGKYGQLEERIKQLEQCNQDVSRNG